MATDADIVAFDQAPYDELSLGKVVIATEDKDAKGEKLRIAVRTARTIVENTFGIIT